MVHPWSPACSGRVARALRLGLCLVAVWPATGAARAPSVAPLQGQAAGPARPSAIRVRGRIAPPPGADLPAVQSLRVEAVDVAAEPDAVRARRLFAGAPEPPPLASTHPDATGAFELRLPASGFYRLRLEAAGFLALALDLSPLLEDVDLPMAELTPAGAPLKVTVLAAAGHPTAGVLAGIRRLRSPATPGAPSDPSAIDAEAGSWHPARRVAVTAADGTLVLPRARGEAVEILASDDGWPPAATVAGEAPTAILRLPSRPTRILAVHRAGGDSAAGALVRQGGLWIGLTGLDGHLAVAIPAKAAVTLSIRSADGQAAEVLWPAAGAAVPGELPATLQPPRAVAGRVVDAATRRPLAGALVLGDLGPPARTAIDGGFRLLAPEPGEAKVQAFAVRHLALHASLPLPAAPPPSARASAAGGEPVVLPLEPAARLAGRVIDERGRPVAGAAVAAAPRFVRPHRVRGEAAARSGADGGFTIDQAVADEPYEVSAVAAGFAPTTLVTRTAGAAGAALGHAPVPRLPDPTSLVLMLRAGAAVFGRVADTAARPLPDAEVELQRTGRMPHHVGEGLHTARSDALGAFLVPHLPPGSYLLTVLHPGFAPAQAAGIDLPAAAARRDLGTVTLQPGAAIYGTVVDAAGRPVAGAKASLSGRAVPWLSSISSAKRALEPSLETDVDGSFRFADLMPGAVFDLDVVSPGHLPAHEPFLAAPAHEALRIELKAAQTLEGRVLEADGKPIAGAQLREQHGNETTTWAAGGGWITKSASTVSGPDGRFTLGDLAPGKLDVLVHATGHPNHLVPGVSIPEQGSPERLEVVMPRGAMLAGTVALEDGTPVVGATVAAVERAVQRVAGLWGDGEATNGITDGDGHYRLQGLAAGTYMVSARGREGERAEAAIDVTAGDNQLDLACQVGNEVSGAVVDDAGLPVADAAVTLGNAGGHEPQSSVSAADGSFRFPRVADGTYSLSAIKAGYLAAAASPPPQVGGHPLRGIELRLRTADATVTGRLLGLTAAERSAVYIQAVTTAPGDAESSALMLPPVAGFAALDGSYRIPGVAPGEWRVEAAIGRARQAHGAVVVGPETLEVSLDLDFRSGATVSGTVLVDEQPLVAALVGIQSNDHGDDDPALAATDRDGRFTIANLTPGPHTLVLADGSRGIGYVRQIEVVDPGSGGQQPELALAFETGAMTGRVALPDGSPVAGATVQLERPDAPVFGPFPGPERLTDGGGAFAVPYLLAGTWQVTATRDGTVLAQASVEVQPHQTAILELAANGTAAAGRSGSGDRSRDR
ncbi:MAG TPA: carboxypeptidase regulatory-like domain-containing protein [Thermoanaerobaculia bacterium]|nr:carboxypeptidase regulatory-like domain-containing protein [Thermoanaerobaculia bacterium]